MEVHHHPDLHHENKHFKEYFLEFLMIFLVVTMGFISENLRGAFTNRSKEREYIAGFIRKVEDDTADLRHVINFDRQQVKGRDSFLMLAHGSMAADSNRKTFYRLAMGYFYNSASFKSNDATLQQLKSTGDYRLIVKHHVADSLSLYDADIRNIYIQGNYYDAYFKDILSRLDELADMTVFGDTSFVKNGKLLNKPLPQMSPDSSKFRTLFNKVFDFRIITSSYSNNYLEPQRSPV